eukprot:scaffold362_cov246-Pinguiococcus_pyrenoidosus.AAC.6
MEVQSLGDGCGQSPTTIQLHKSASPKRCALTQSASFLPTRRPRRPFCFRMICAGSRQTWKL